MLNVNDDLLHDAIARNAAVVLSLPSAGMLRHCKSRFLAEEGGEFWVESVPEERVLIDELIAQRKPAGISFKSSTTRVVFTTSISRRMTEYRINTETVVEAVALRFPTEIKAVQRRNNYRVHIPQDCDLKVRIWRIGPRAYIKDRPMAAQELTSEIRDLSVGGMGVIFTGNDGCPPRITPEDRLRVQLEFRDISLVLEANMRYPVTPICTETIRAGIQFKALQNDLEGRQILARLTRIVGELQREEVRHYWLGMSRAV